MDVAAAEKMLKDAQEAMANPAMGIDIVSALIEVKHAQARVDAGNEQKKQ